MGFAQMNTTSKNASLTKSLVLIILFIDSPNLHPYYEESGADMREDYL